MKQSRLNDYIAARNQNSAWVLLASRRAPLVIACLESLFEEAHNGVLIDDALHELAAMLAPHANDEQYQIDPKRLPQLAGRELRQWISRSLVVERGGRIYATDALQAAISFVQGLENRIMTSTASRLSVVQRVFESFQAQLRESVDLDHMRERLREILVHDVSRKALNSQQQNDLRFLVGRLVNESEAVFQARSRSERDVKGFLKTGLAAEHHRVGQLLAEIFQEMLHLDWQRAATRRVDSPLPPVAIPIAGMPLIERLRYKTLDSETAAELDLSQTNGEAATFDEDFWANFDGLDREAVIAETIALRKEQQHYRCNINLRQISCCTTQIQHQNFMSYSIHCCRVLCRKQTRLI